MWPLQEICLDMMTKDKVNLSQCLFKYHNMKKYTLRN
jgi:hypothetical protein